MKKQERRYNELKEKDTKIRTAIYACSQNICAMERLIIKEESEINRLLAAQKEFEVELLELQAEKDFNSDVSAETLPAKL